MTHSLLNAIKWYFLHVVSRKPVLPLPTIVPFPPFLFYFVHVLDDGMFWKRQLVLNVCSV